jgi:uncharacterized DUF497 family protein
LYEFGGRFFDWDEDKRKSNFRKHGVDFEEAVTVFWDFHAIIKHDLANSLDEDRFLVIGTSRNSRTLLICHCYRDDGKVTRIISARKANAKERRQYEGGR